MKTDPAAGETLGQHLRAFRLRFGFMPRLRAYMRLSIVGDDLFRAELLPPDQLPKTPDGTSYVLWYVRSADPHMRPDLERLCQRVLTGGPPGRLKRPVRFLFDGDGQFKSWAT